MQNSRAIRATLAAAALAGVLLPSPPLRALTSKDFTVEGKVAVLQGLDKVTARVSTIEAPLDEPVTFGSLEVVVRVCRKTPPTEVPESAAFVEIDDAPPDGEKQRIFTGWMFASSPALNALEHPVYDVWLLDCKNSSSSE
jgi:hypothetical protein